MTKDLKMFIVKGLKRVHYNGINKEMFSVTYFKITGIITYWDIPDF